MSTTDAPAFYRTGRFTPVPAETTRTELEVIGTIPVELNGRYLRNGPNPRSGGVGHWFLGDGMVHGVELRDGRASWYRNRWVRSATFTDGAKVVRDDFTIDHTAGAINTNVIAHAGKILALAESSFPFALTPQLDTIGPFDFDGRLTTAMTAHPKVCPTTGELHFFGYGYTAPFLTYHCADAEGRLVRSEVIDVPGSTMIHDFAITAHHVVFLDLPVVFDLDLALQGTMPYCWDDDYGARIGVLPRDGRSPVRWFDIAPCYVFHVLNAYETPGRIVIDGVRYEEIWRNGPDDFRKSTMHRWTIDTTSGAVTETALDDLDCEFPRLDDRRTGLPHTVGYTVHVDETDAPTGSILRYDLGSGARSSFGFGPGRVPGEAVFVPARPDARETDGYLLTYVYDHHTNHSDLVILDASDTSAPPVATIELAARVPAGFHGNWISD